MKPPQQSLYLLVDSVDEGCNITEGEQTSTSLSGTVAELLAGHHEFFPPWLLLLCSARKQSKAVTKMFTGKCNYCHVCISMCYWYISKLSYLLNCLLAFLCKCHTGLIFFIFCTLTSQPLLSPILLFWIIYFYFYSSGITYFNTILLKIITINDINKKY